MPTFSPHGVEWVVDATGADPRALRDPRVLRALFDEIVRDLDLHPVGRPRWHRFPGEGGVTGFLMLSESHLACHTFPEFGSICINLFCCRTRPAWPWTARLMDRLSARTVTIRCVRRDYGADPLEAAS